MDQETKQEEKKEKKQGQAQSQLTWDPNNPDPFNRRRQIAIHGGKKPKKDDEKPLHNKDNIKDEST